MKNNQNLYAVILAGGSGTRFWPLSTERSPKQFLKIIGKKSLFQASIERLKGFVHPSHIYIVSNAGFRQELVRQLAGISIPSGNILYEPKGKNTAPAIAWAASVIQRKNKNAVMMIFPSDHLILNQELFITLLKKAISLARRELLVTFGIEPNRPETGYGYLRVIKKNNVFKVTRFTEKPSLKKAKQFLKQGNYWWNSGMLVWKTESILEEFKKFLPRAYKLVSLSKPMDRRRWAKMPYISIDYAVLEKSKRVVAVGARGLQWSDLGSWEALSEILPKDKQGNFLNGEIKALGCENIFVWGHKRPIAVIGLKDVVVVDTPGGLLVSPKALSQKVREIVHEFKKS